MEIDFMSYIDPSLSMFIPVLIFIGSVLKQAETVNNKKIPLILLIISIVIANIWVFSKKIPLDGAAEILAGIFTSVCQGALCAAAAVYSHQMYKNIKEDKETSDK